MLSQPRQKIKQVLGVAGVFVCLLGWMHFSTGYLTHALWGPYARTFLETGPGEITLAMNVWVFMVCPILMSVLPLAYASSFLRWFGVQMIALLIYFVFILVSGYYIHHIVGWQGAEESLEFLVTEGRYKAAIDIPSEVKDAITHSAKLAEEGKAPWLPFQGKAS